MFNLSVVPANMKPEASAERFVRVRNPEVLARMLAAPGVDKLSGFVLLSPSSSGRTRLRQDSCRTDRMTALGTQD